MLVFISGGVRSGKSSFAETYAEKKVVEGRVLHYIATSKATDEEMAERIMYHQIDRQESPIHWETWEQPVGLEKISAMFKKDDVVLLDCLTTLLSHELFDPEKVYADWELVFYQKEVFHSIKNAVAAIEKNSSVLFLVSNELLSEPVPDDPGVFAYLRLIGKLHQHFAVASDEAYVVEHGIPVKMKG